MSDDSRSMLPPRPRHPGENRPRDLRPGAPAPSRRDDTGSIRRLSRAEAANPPSVRYRRAMPGPLDASAQRAMASASAPAVMLGTGATDAAGLGTSTVAVASDLGTDPAGSAARGSGDPGNPDNLGNPRSRRRTLASLAVMVAALVVGALSWRLPHQHDFFDFRIYWAATHSWLNGTPLYSFEEPDGSHLGFTYPPFAGLVLAPFSLIPIGASEWVLCGISLAVLAAVAAGIGTAMARALNLPVLPTIVTALALSLGIEPVRESLGFGQINIILLGLMVLDMWLITRRSMYSGIAIGLAAALKLTPAVMVVVLLVRGRRAAGIRAIGAFIGVSVLALALAPTASRQYWTDKMWDSSRVGVAKRYANQSIAGVIARFQDLSKPNTIVWVLFVLAVFALIVVVARAQRGPLGDVRALIIGAAGATALSPISWSHHFVWAVPAFAMVIYDAIRLRSRWQWAPIALAYVAFAYGPVFLSRFTKAWPDPVVDNLRSLLYPAATIILCGLIGWVGYRCRDEATGDDVAANRADERRTDAPGGPDEVHAADLQPPGVR